MSQTGKLMPNLDQQSTKMLNLTVLQRMDPFIEEILITAAHVTFYEFNIDSNQWSRKDVEGSLFVVKRNTQPRFQFIVMNRRNTDNLVENLLEDFEFEIQIPYLLYRNASQEVNGIWFYNARECEDVANLFNRILNAYSKVPPKSKVAPTKSEFAELEAVPTMAVMEGPLEPSAASTAAAADAPDDSFMNIFNAAMSLGNNTANAAAPRQPYHSSAAVPLTSHATVAAYSHVPTPLAPILSLPVSSAPTTLQAPMTVYDTTNSVSSNHNVTNLVKPFTFFTPPSSSALMMPPNTSTAPTNTLHPPLNLQRPYGTPMLQPFPPPTPPPSLTPSTTPSANDLPAINRDKIRDAFLILAQDNQFIDMFHQALLKVHQS